MRARIASIVTFAALLASCGKRVPQPASVQPGTPYVTWIIMSGDRENPDRDFVCQSDFREQCVVPASRPDAPVLSDVHVYYHGVGRETRYSGTVNVGFFRNSREVTTNMTVQRDEAITNQSVTNIVTDKPGEYELVLSHVATVADSGLTQPVSQRIQVVVR